MRNHQRHRHHNSHVAWRCLYCGYTPNLDTVSKFCLQCGRDRNGVPGTLPDMSLVPKDRPQLRRDDAES